MPVLVVKFEGSVLQNVPVNGGPITIGRSPGNSIAIDNLSVSTHHAQIEVQEGRLILDDPGSLNGTFVNGQRVKRATLKVIPGAPHGMCSTLKDNINAELLAFLRS